MQARTTRANKRLPKERELPERDTYYRGADYDDYEPYHEDDVQKSGLETLNSSGFHVVLPCESGEGYGSAKIWKAMNSNWSMEAHPGEWCRRALDTGVIWPESSRPVKPEGIIVAVLTHVPLGSERFVVMWFSDGVSYKRRVV